VLQEKERVCSNRGGEKVPLLGRMNRRHQRKKRNAGPEKKERTSADPKRTRSRPFPKCVRGKASTLRREMTELQGEVLCSGRAALSTYRGAVRGEKEAQKSSRRTAVAVSNPKLLPGIVGGDQRKGGKRGRKKNLLGGKRLEGYDSLNFRGKILPRMEKKSSKGREGTHRKKRRVGEEKAVTFFPVRRRLLCISSAEGKKKKTERKKTQRHSCGKEGPSRKGIANQQPGGEKTP